MKEQNPNQAIRAINYCLKYIANFAMNRIKTESLNSHFFPFSNINLEKSSVASQTITSAESQTKTPLNFGNGEFGWIIAGGCLKNQSEYQNSHFSLNCDHIMKIVGPNVDLENCKQCATDLATFLSNSRYKQVGLCDVSPDLFSKESLKLLTDLYDIVYVPQVEMSKNDTSSSKVGAMVLVAKTKHNSYEVNVIPDAQKLQSIPDGAAIYSTVCLVIDKKTIVDSSYGSPFSSPESREKTFLNIVTWLKSQELPFWLGGDWNTYCSVNAVKGHNPLRFLLEALLDNARENLARQISLPIGMNYNYAEISTFLGVSDLEMKGVSSRLKRFLFTRLIKYSLDAIFTNSKAEITTTKLPSTDHLGVTIKLEEN